MADLEGARAEVDGVKRPCARPWLRRRRAEPGIMEAEGRTDWWYAGVEKEDAAETGRGDGALFAAGREVREVEGVKSKRGARRGATPYCAAMSRPRSSGILRKWMRKGARRGSGMCTKCLDIYRTRPARFRAFREGFLSRVSLYVCPFLCRRP